jgi:glycosyltransferase involved in cell wall biosynthesis
MISSGGRSWTRSKHAEIAREREKSLSIDPLVSAIIPTYNRAHIVCEAVDSILQQSYGRIEIIVVDDGSKDDTKARLEQYGSRIRVISQVNAGPAAARNRGMEVAKGELVAFLDSDDIWLPTKIERQVALLQKVGESVPCCLCNIAMQWRSGERASFDISALKPDSTEGVWLNPDEVLATRFVLFNQGVVIRRQVLGRICGFDEKFRCLEDYEFSLRLSLEGPWAFIEEPLVIWRESMTNSLYKNSQKEEISTSECKVEIFERHLATVAGGHQRGRLLWYVDRELKNARRQLWMAKIKQESFWGSAIASSVCKIEQYRNAIFRRSPWFPKMKVESSERWASQSAR